MLRSPTSACVGSLVRTATMGVGSLPTQAILPALRTENQITDLDRQGPRGPLEGGSFEMGSCC